MACVSFPHGAGQTGGEVIALVTALCSETEKHIRFMNQKATVNNRGENSQRGACDVCESQKEVHCYTMSRSSIELF